MSKIGERIARFSPSPSLASGGVKGYRLYFAPAPYEYTLESYDTVLNIDVGLPPVVDGKHVVNVGSYPEIAGLPEGKYDVATVPYDASNLGNFAETENVPLDFNPPEAAGAPEFDE